MFEKYKIATNIKMKQILSILHSIFLQFTVEYTIVAIHVQNIKSKNKL